MLDSNGPNKEDFINVNFVQMVDFQLAVTI